tara:strand:+ start:366 stop:866 length:501 start_codon:yes stop_codon:yes gene_type:complete
MENEEEQQSNPIVDFFKNLFSGSGGQGSSANMGSSGNNEANDGDADVGFMNSLMMGLGLRDPTDDYYRATMDSIRRTRGPQAAEQYRQQMQGQGVLSVPGALGNYDMATGAVTGMPPTAGMSNMKPQPRPPQGVMSLPTAQDQLLNMQRQNMQMQTGGPGQIYPLV